jgi:hypothetical protein
MMWSSSIQEDAMTDLFRFVALRAPVSRQPGGVPDLGTRSPFQQRLAEVRQEHMPIDAARRLAQEFATGDLGGIFLNYTIVVPRREAFDELAASAASAHNRAELTADVQAAFGATAQGIAEDQQFQELLVNVKDTIVAVFIDPALRSLPLADLALIARLLLLIVRVARDDASLDAPGAITRALNLTLLLPPGVFPLRLGLPQPVGVGDLLVVKQHLKRYELSDISTIENILKGETRTKTDVHELTLDTTVMTDLSKTTETTTSLDVTERFELKTESENVVKEDLAANAGVNVSAKYGAVEINANASVSYNLSKEQSSKVATEHAKDVTSRAATKVTDSVRRQEIARTIEKLAERELHSFKNTEAGGANVSGVYQWLNKVYEAQVFNYGKRLMFDIVIPEPAAFLKDAVTSGQQSQAILPPEPFAVIADPATPNGWRPVRAADLGPDGLLSAGVTSRPLTPADLDPTAGAPLYYGAFMAKYAALGVNAPPEPTTTVSKAITGNKDDHDHLAAADDLQIPQGYRATSLAVQGAFTLYEEEDGDERMWVFVGKHRFECKGQGNLGPKAALLPDPMDHRVDEQGSMPVAIETQQARDFAVTIDVTCAVTDAAMDQWRLDTFGSLVNAYKDLTSSYQDQLKAQAVSAPKEAVIGQNPAQNRLLERAELKKSCVAMLSGTDLYEADIDDVAVNATPPTFPRPHVPGRVNPNLAGGDQEAFIRFFEQAFEWEHIMYVFYPYFWSRRGTWYSSALADDADPLFAEFVKAGAARVVIPVRPQLEGDVRYFLMTGQIWNGGAMPGITDEDYLPITEEIREQDDAPGTETPQGPPWEVTLPTTLIQLREGPDLPSWQKFTVDGAEVWVPGRDQSGGWEPDYGRLNAQGDWTP